MLQKYMVKIPFYTVVQQALANTYPLPYKGRSTDLEFLF